MSVWKVRMGEWLQSEHDYGQIQTNTDDYGHQPTDLLSVTVRILSVKVRKSPLNRW